MKEIFDVTKRLRKSVVHQFARLDELGRGLERAEPAFAHFPRLPAICQAVSRPVPLNACLSARKILAALR